MLTAHGRKLFCRSLLQPGLGETAVPWRPVYDRYRPRVQSHKNSGQARVGRKALLRARRAAEARRAPSEEALVEVKHSDAGLEVVKKI